MENSNGGIHQKKSHAVVNYPEEQQYGGKDVNDIFFASGLDKKLYIKGRSPIYWDAKHFRDFRFADDEFEAEYVGDNDGWAAGRVIICSLLERPSKGEIAELCSVTVAANPALVIIPIRKGEEPHFTVLILDPQRQEAYYFDSNGRNGLSCQECCETLKYQYAFNKKKLQYDKTSCGPGIIKFSLLVVECIEQGLRIGDVQMPEFGFSPVSSRRKNAGEMIEGQKALLYCINKSNNKIPLQTGFSQHIFSRATDLTSPSNFENMVIGNIYTFPNLQCLGDYEDGKEYSLLMFLCGITGTALGFFVSQQDAVNAEVTRFLIRILATQYASASMTSSAAITTIGGLLGFVGGAIGDEIAGNLGASRG